MVSLREMGARAVAPEVRPVWDIERPSWPLRVPGASMAGFRDRSEGPIELHAVPHPAVMVVIELGAGSFVVDDPTGDQRCGSLVAGLLPGALHARGAHIECVQLRLSPLVAPAVLGASGRELDRSVLRSDDLLGPDAERIEDQLRRARSWPDRFALLEGWLLRRTEARRSVDPEVAWAWKQIVASGGQVRVEELATEIGWSRKRLWARFRSQIGRSPKAAASLVRFDAAARQLAAGRSPATVAADGGYADQSHLHREVRAFTGTTPAGLAREPWLSVDDVAWPDHATFVQDDRPPPR